MACLAWEARSLRSCRTSASLQMIVCPLAMREGHPLVTREGEGAGAVVREEEEAEALAARLILMEADLEEGRGDAISEG